MGQQARNFIYLILERFPRISLQFCWTFSEYNINQDSTALAIPVQIGSG